MKKFLKLFVITLVFIAISSALLACENPYNSSNGTVEDKDYVKELKLDMQSPTAKTEATVRTFIDGDTTHFNVPESVVSDGVLKARYIAIDTPESTGQIEEYGKKAADFTKTKLKTAVSIMLESNNGSWNHDSTGVRYLVWVWYKPSEGADYRNLNLEILQNGLCKKKSTLDTRYGEICVNAHDQAIRQKLNAYSGQKDPDFYYGDVINLTMRELRLNIETYNRKKVAVDGLVTYIYNNGCFVQDYDPETDTTYGVYVYYMMSNGYTKKILKPGNYVHIVGTTTQFEATGQYQISGLVDYSPYDKDNPEITHLISSDNEVDFPVVDADKYLGKDKIQFEVKDETDPEKTVLKTIEDDFARLHFHTTIAMENLTVTRVSTTASNGAMTLTCTVNGKTVKVRTDTLYDENNEIVTADYFEGKTIDIRGIVNSYKYNEDAEEQFQIQLLTLSDVTIK